MPKYPVMESGKNQQRRKRGGQKPSPKALIGFRLVGVEASAQRKARTGLLR